MPRPWLLAPLAPPNRPANPLEVGNDLPLPTFECANTLISS